MTVEDIRRRLFSLQDEKYRDFQIKLTPGVAPETFIGIRTPVLREFAKELFQAGDYEAFLQDLPHRYFDENNLHAFLICLLKDYDVCIAELERFLPFVDNWATCDQMRPKAFAKHKDRLMEKIRRWMASERTYTIRFGIEMLMTFYLDGDFRPEYLEMAAAIRSEEYYVNMMTAWFFATALAKQYDAALPYIEQRRLDAWTHRKAIQKAIESYRITPEQKAYLRTLK